MIANIASDDVLILPHRANPCRIEFSGTTGLITDELAIASLLLFDLEIYCRFLAAIVLNLIFNVLSFIE